jgi:beta-lactamase regulating signal transducer with metallopeptidase domain
MALPSPQMFAAAIEHLGPHALVTAGGGAIILALAGAATLAMRHASAAARHQVWLLGFIGVLVLPLLSATLPAWRVLPWHVSRAPSPAPTLDAVAPPLPLPISNAEITDPIKRREPATNAITGAARTPPPLAETTPVSRIQPAGASSPPPARLSWVREMTWTDWALVCWALGATMLLCRLLLGHLSLVALRRRCTRVTRGELFDSLQCLCQEIGLRRRPDLLTCPARAMPMTWGLWRPRLLVPEEAATWTAAQRRDVLLHELGHVCRWDCLTQFLSQVACAVYWFNPLAWVASARMRVERERACDDLVLNRGARPAIYARHLLESVSFVPALKLAGAAVAMARPSTLEERMNAILNPRQSRRGISARRSLVTILLLALAVIPVAALRAQQAPPDAPPPDRAPSQARRGGAGSATRPASTRRGFLGFGAAPAPTLGEGPTCAFDATIYEVHLPANQIGKLDVAALAEASTSPDGFEKALAALGPAKPLYRADQSVRLGGDSVTINSQVPVVTSNTVTAMGQTVSNYAYQSVGARFTLAGKAAPAGHAELDLSIQIACVSDTGVVIGPNVTAPVIRTATLSRKGPFEPRKPFVIVSADASSPDKDGKAVAYIARVTLGEPQSAASK